MKRTALYENHKALGAKFTEFAGWEMPVRYSSVNEEHFAVRNAAGLFDVSHMGEIFLSGSGAEAFLEHVLSNRVSKLETGEAQYTLLLNQQGCTVDDLILYKLSADRFMLCVNAANADKDFEWLERQRKESGASFGEFELENRSSEFGQLALQGPAAEKILCKALELNEADYRESAFPAFQFRRLEARCGSEHKDIYIARTGYTGEDGFEIFVPVSALVSLWERLLEVGSEHGIKPIGLAARDTLRLEACYPLHGHELSESLSPLSAGLSWAIKLDKDFIGAAELRAEKAAGPDTRLVALTVTGAGIVREDTAIFRSGEDQPLGIATSGTKVPTQEKPIAMAFVAADAAKPGTELEAEVRGRRFPVKVVRKPIYKRSA